MTSDKQQLNRVKAVIASAACAYVLAVAGCNTTKGLGKDIEATGEALGDAADDVSDAVDDAADDAEDTIEDATDDHNR